MARPKLPETLSRAFVIDLEYFCRMFYSNKDCGYGILHQREMQKRHSAKIMQWVFDEVGIFTEG